VRVHAVLIGPVDTDMNQGAGLREVLADTPMASAESVARAIFDGVENEEEDIFPDPMSAAMADGWRSGAVKAFEHQLAALAEAEPARQ
jgi:short-subunit dehydrogenase